MLLNLGRGRGADVYADARDGTVGRNRDRYRTAEPADGRQQAGQREDRALSDQPDRRRRSQGDVPYQRLFLHDLERPAAGVQSCGRRTDRSYKPDSIWIPHVFLVNAAAQREKTNVNIKGNPDGTIHYLELFKAELTTSFYLEPFPFELAPSWWTPGLSCQPLIVTSFEFCGTTIAERRMAPPAVIE